MIANGRRIEQRTELGTHEGLEGFKLHLRRCGFDPISFDGRDPAAFVCTLWEMEQRLERRVQEKNSGILRYPLPIPTASPRRSRASASMAPAATPRTTCRCRAIRITTNRPGNCSTSMQ